jgi:hypothetical protein
MARWRIGGRPASRSYETAELRADFASKWAEQRAKFGREAPSVTPRQVEVWNEFARLTGGEDPIEVARWWQRVRGQVGGKITCARAVEDYVRMREAQPNRRDTINHLRLHLRRFAEHFGDKPMGMLTPDSLRAWLAGLKSDRLGDQPLAAGSQRHHYLSANVLLGHAVRFGWLDRNPLDLVDAPSAMPRDDVGILTVDQVRELFKRNAHRPVVGRLALEAFGGLRASSAGRLVAEHLKWDLHGLELPASQHKSGRRHFTDGHPANLWPWLKHAPASCWTMTERTYAQEKAIAFEIAEVPHPHNCLRHSFATYHLHGFKDPGRTAVLMQHRRSPEILWRHYAGRATEKDGRSYFKIMPPR